ncbi:MAG: hypothetical protein ACRDD2_05080 [Sarcina sp.]
MKDLKIYLLLIFSLLFLFFQALVYNKYNSNNLKENKIIINEEKEVEKEREIQLKEFKEKIESEFIEFKEIKKNNGSFIARIQFKGDYVELKNYIKDIDEKGFFVNDYTIRGELENLLVTLTIE